MLAPGHLRRWLGMAALVVPLIHVSIGDLRAQTDKATIKAEILGGQRELEALKKQETSFDSNQEIVEYLNEIVSKLLASARRPAPYPITVHFSSVVQVNAHSLPGGPIVVDERMFDLADTEAQFVAVLAHETAHQLNNDSLNRKADYLREHPAGSKPWDWEIVHWDELRADGDGARLMYDAGWDPQGMIDLYGRRSFPNGFTHPSNEKRIQAVKSVLAQLPPKTGLINDSVRFRELKAKY